MPPEDAPRCQGVGMSNGVRTNVPELDLHHAGCGGTHMARPLPYPSNPLVSAGRGSCWHPCPGPSIRQSLKRGRVLLRMVRSAPQCLWQTRALEVGDLLAQGLPASARHRSCAHHRLPWPLSSVRAGTGSERDVQRNFQRCPCVRRPCRSHRSLRLGEKRDGLSTGPRGGERAEKRNKREGGIRAPAGRLACPALPWLAVRPRWKS